MHCYCYVVSTLDTTRVGSGEDNSQLQNSRTLKEYSSGSSPCFCCLGCRRFSYLVFFSCKGWEILSLVTGRGEWLSLDIPSANNSDSDHWLYFYFSFIATFCKRSESFARHPGILTLMLCLNWDMVCMISFVWRTYTRMKNKRRVAFTDIFKVFNVTWFLSKRGGGPGWDT